jgi:hypothetical protein
MDRILEKDGMPAPGKTLWKAYPKGNALSILVRVVPHAALCY